MKKLLLSILALFTAVAAMAYCPVEYQGNITIGSSFGTLSLNKDGLVVVSDKTVFLPEIETVHGAKFGKHFFLGAGSGFRYQYGDGTYAMQLGYVPLYAELQGIIPITEKISSYIMADLGYGFCTYINNSKSYLLDNMTIPGGFCAKAGVGFDINHFVIALGYSYQGMTVQSKNPIYNEKYNWGTNAFFVKLGVSF